MRVGLTWSERIKFQPPGTQMRSEEAQYEVQAFEKIKTPKGEFDAFKLVMTMNALKGARPSQGVPQKFGLTLTTMLPMSKLLLPFRHLQLS